MNYEVSVIITNYNRYHVVKDAVESVLCQSFKDFEIILVDDSSDISANVYLSHYLPRIKIIQNSVNKGISSARNIGAFASKGRYLAFLDSDDIWLNEKLRLQLQIMQKEGTKICHTNEFWFKENRYVNCGKKHNKYGGNIFPYILDKCRVSPSSFIIERGIFLDSGGFKESLRVCEDYELFIRLSSKHIFSYSPYKLIVKRALFKDSLSNKIQHIESIRLDILKELYNKHNFSFDQLIIMKEEIARKERIVRCPN